MILYIAIAVVAILLYFYISHYISYEILKKRILKERKWDLNICCGKTDGGGINADIFKHKDVPNFVEVLDIYNLPFKDKQFDKVLCSHTIEHVDDPQRFFNELQRVGNEVTVVIPPLYDTTAVLNFFEHKWIFWSFRKKHTKLPYFTRLPLAGFIQKNFGQINHA